MFIMCLILVDNLNIFTLYLKDNDNNYDNKKKNYKRREEERKGEREERDDRLK